MKHCQWQGMPFYLFQQFYNFCALFMSKLNNNTTTIDLSNLSLVFTLSFGGSEKSRFRVLSWRWHKYLLTYLGTFTPDTPGQLDVLGHDGYPLGVDGAQVGVFEQAHQVRLTRLLQSHHSGRLKPQVGLEILRDFTNQTLKWQLPDQKLGALLVTPDFSQRHRTRSIPMRLFDTAGSGCTFPGGLGGQLLSGCFSTGRLSGSLLSTSHLK